MKPIPLPPDTEIRIRAALARTLAEGAMSSEGRACTILFLTTGELVGDYTRLGVDGNSTGIAYWAEWVLRWMFPRATTGYHPGLALSNCEGNLGHLERRLNESRLQ